MMIRIIVGVILFLTVACRKAKFIADPSDTRLPEYSQEGRNIAGALINDQPWRSKIFSHSNPLVITSSPSGDSIIFGLRVYTP